MSLSHLVDPSAKAKAKDKITYFRHHFFSAIHENEVHLAINMNLSKNICFFFVKYTLSSWANCMDCLKERRRTKFLKTSTHV